MENLERGSLASFGSGGTTDSEPAVQGRPGGLEAARVSRTTKQPPARGQPVVKEVVVANKEVVVEEVAVEDEKEEMVPAMTALDPAKRLDRLVSFLKL
jgi:hypothetical protein